VTCFYSIIKSEQPPELAIWRTPGARSVGQGLVVPLDRRRIVDADHAGGDEGDGRQDDDDGGHGNTRGGAHDDLRGTQVAVPDLVGNLGRGVVVGPEPADQYRHAANSDQDVLCKFQDGAPLAQMELHLLPTVNIDVHILVVFLQIVNEPTAVTQ